MEEWQKKWIEKNLVKLVEETELSPKLIAYFKSTIFSSSDCQSLEIKLRNEGSEAQAYKFYEIAQKKHESYDIIVQGFNDHQVSGPAKILEEGAGLKGKTSNEHNISPNKIAVGLFTDKKNPPGPIPRGRPVSTDAVDSRLVTEFEILLSAVAPLDVVVEPPSFDMQAMFNDAYKLPYQDKGAALLLNIKYFENAELAERQGSENDVKYLRTVFKTFGYNIYREADIDRMGEKWSKIAFMSLIQEFQDFCNRAQPKSIIIFIGSHGGFNKIYMSDPPERKQQRWDEPAKNVDVTVSLEVDIFSMFNSTNCPGLKGKPKIFLISACQKFQVETDDADVEPPVDDMIILTAQAPGFKSYRDAVTGSWLTHCLTWVMMKYAKEKSLQEMLKMVQEIMKTFPKDYYGLQHGQIPVISDRGLGPLYFFMEPTK